MTPDELRRMDNDLCIIFEKGIKPVKANKYYYFKYSKIVNDLDRSAISHNDIGEIQRGNWRKFNPYNPWTQESENQNVQDLKVESLDDLFEDDKETVKPIESIQEEVKLEEKPVSQIDNKKIIEDEEDTYDLQKELELKFDELFGPLD